MRFVYFFFDALTYSELLLCTKCAVQIKLPCQYASCTSSDRTQLLRHCVRFDDAHYVDIITELLIK